MALPVSSPVLPAAVRKRGPSGSRRCVRRRYIRRGTYPDCHGRGPRAPYRLSRAGAPAAAALDKIIFHLHLEHRINARKAVNHDGDECAISQADERGFLGCGFAAPGVSDDRNAIEQLPGFLGREHRGLALLHHIFRTAHGVGGVYLDDMAEHQPIEEHAQRGQVLFHRGRRERFPSWGKVFLLQVLDEEGGVGRLDGG
jgi:hypothetical protein